MERLHRKHFASRQYNYEMKNHTEEQAVIGFAKADNHNCTSVVGSSFIEMNKCTLQVFFDEDGNVVDVKKL